MYMLQMYMYIYVYVYVTITAVVTIGVESGLDDPDNLGHLSHFFRESSGSHL